MSIIAAARVAVITLAVSLPIWGEAGDASELVRIGERLFADKRLSIDGSLSCASCHMPERAFSDGRPVAVGLHGQQGVRNTPSLTTTAYNTMFAWDGRQATLEAQVVAPFLNPREHAFSSHDEVVALIKTSEDYPLEFRRHATIERVGGALAEFVRSITARSSRFDRYWFGSDRTALTEEERRGLEIFRGPAGCASCHELTASSARLTDGGFHALGVSADKLGLNLAEVATRSMRATPAELRRLITGDPAIAALGRFNVTKKPADIGKYRTPSLRNVAVTAPYMHDGSVATLEEAIELEVYYRAIEQGRPLLLTPAEKRNLAAFLRALTSETYEQAQGRQ